MRRYMGFLVVLPMLLAGCGMASWRDAPRGDPGACANSCQGRYQACMADTGSYGDCAEASRQSACERITDPELRGACQTSQAFCQSRSRSAVCGERLGNCMVGCN